MIRDLKIFSCVWIVGALLAAPFLVSSSWGAPRGAPTVGAAAEKFPRPTGHVNDFANVLTYEAKSALEDMAVVLQERTQIELAVVTMNLGEGSIEDTATRLYAAWGIGKRGKDNGILILMAPDIHGVRIETGYGIEGVMPDAVAGRIIRDVMIPRFRQGDLEGGLKAGSLAVIARITEGLGIEIEGMPAIDQPGAGRQPVQIPLVIRLLLLLLFIYLFIKHPRLLLFILLMSSGRGGGMRRGGFGGGFGGFGGGLSGGGGSSGRW